MSAPIITGSRCSAGRPYPSIQDVDPQTIGDFGPHSVLLDFSGNPEDPEIAFLGRALRVECALDGAIRQISEVPGRSLLSRLTDHYLQIIANRAPIGFEAEFVGMRGHNTLYRGILMPLSSDGQGDRFHLRRDQLEGDRRRRDRVRDRRRGRPRARRRAGAARLAQRRRIAGLGRRPQFQLCRSGGDRRPRRADRQGDLEPVARRRPRRPALGRPRQRRRGGRLRRAQPRRALPRARLRL